MEAKSPNLCYNEDMKICKDGRIWGQNNREAGKHLGILKDKKPNYDGKGYHKGNKNPMYGRTGNQSPRFGTSHREETRRTLSEQKKGEEHPNWKGGITGKRKVILNGIEYRLWREAVFARDNWTCQECGKRGGWLNAHHKKPYFQFPELHLAIDNGITLCLNCHRAVDNH